MILDPRADKERRFASRADVDEFVDVLEKYERGEIDAQAFKEFRLTRGVYGQRQEGQHMIRVKIPQGILSARQLRLLGRIARERSRGFGHVTTRQNVQFHRVRLEDTEAALSELNDVGLTTREACGNTVRNVTACPLAGVCGGEVFDVTPYAEGLTRFLLRHPDAQAMPRKFKIAFSGCADDCAFGAIHDVAALATRGEHGERAFRILAGGGLATHPTSALVLEERLPAPELARAVLAVVRVQQKHGERKNRGRARLKYTVKRLGVDGFLSEYRAELERITDGQAPVLVETPAEDGALLPPGPAWSALPSPAAGGYAAWASLNIFPQRQEGWVVLKVRLPLGDVTEDQFDAIAGLAENVSDGTVRLSIDQNLLLRWVPTDRVREAYRVLESIGLAGADAGALDDPTSCPGADTCKLAITHSRQLARALGKTLPRQKTASSRGATVKISGCPNSCGQHHVATIGFHGSTARAADRVIPVYQLHLGGGVDASGATFGRVLNKIPVHRVNEAVANLLGAYDREHEPGETPLTYFRRLSKERVTEILGDTVSLAPPLLQSEDFEDLGTGVPFRVVVSKGECAS